MGPMITATKTKHNKLIKTQRPLAIRVASAYRTASSPALFVIARMIPWQLRAQDRFNRYYKKKTKKRGENRNTDCMANRMG